LIEILNITTDVENVSATVEAIWQHMWIYVCTVDDLSSNLQYYIMDQVGNSLVPAYDPMQLLDQDVSNKSTSIDDAGINIQTPRYNSKVTANFSCGVVFGPDGMGYTLMWPVQNVEKDNLICCCGINNGIVKRLSLMSTLSYFPFKESDDDADIVYSDCDPSENMYYSSFPQIADDSTGSSNSSTVQAVVTELSQNLRRYNYSVKTASERLNLSGFGYCFPAWELSSPNYVQSFINRMTVNDLDSKDFAIDVLISLFLLGSSVSAKAATQILGCALVKDLCALGVLYVMRERSSNQESNIVPQTLIYSNIQITPVAHEDFQSDIFIATDYSHISKHCGFEPVMYVGPDSLALVQSMHGCGSVSNENPHKSCLDVFSGSGVQSISLMKCGRVEKITMLEKNSRAARFARFNIALNMISFDAAYVIRGDIFTLSNIMTKDSDIIYPRKFDLIVANPPYIPSGVDIDSNGNNGDDENRGLLAYGDGGCLGETFTDALFNQLSFGLCDISPTKDCLVCIVANLVNIKDYNTKLSKWLNGYNCNANCLVLHGELWNPNVYSDLILHRNKLHSNSSLQYDSLDASKYASDLRLCGVDTVTNGLVFCRLSSVSTDGANEMIPVVKTEIEESDKQLWQVIALTESMERQKIRNRIKLFLFEQ
jgi:hypothetical protein